MIRLIQRRLIIPRGDTGSFSIPVLSKGGTDNIAVFTIFDETTRTKMFQKIISGEGDVLTIAFTHSDTVNLKPGKYVWDIKYYKNPEYIDDELVNGEEIDSYYAGFSLPVCEIRETADNYLVSPEAPTATLSPEQLEIVTGAIHSLNEAIRKTQENVEHYPEIRDEVWYVWDAELGDYVSTDVRANGIVGNGIASAVLNNDYTLTLNFTDGTSFTSPSIRGQRGNGIDDIVLNNDFTLTISYTDGESYTTPSIRGPIGPTPQFSIGTVQEGPSVAASITGTAENPVLNLTLSNAYVPTRVSELENDANYAVDANYIHTDNNYTTAEKNKLSGIAAGAEVNVNADWNAVSGDAQILNKPTKVSNFTNDVGYLTEHQDISGKADKSEIPTKVSQLQNDSGYLTSYTETDPTVPAWAKAAQKPSYTAAEVGAPTVAEMNTAIGTAIGQINSFDMAVVQTLPTQDISTHTIYLIPKTGETNDVYDEYVYINNNWEMVGNTQVDLSDYATKDELPDVPVQDVQVNGTSILNVQGVAEIPNFGENTYGLVRSNDIPVQPGSGESSIEGKPIVVGNNVFSNIASSRGSVALGDRAKASGIASMAFGSITEAIGPYSFAQGQSTEAIGQTSHAEGSSTIAVGDASHSEGASGVAYGITSHFEGIAASDEYNINLTSTNDNVKYSLSTNIPAYICVGTYIFNKDNINAGAIITDLDRDNNIITLDKTLGTLNNQRCSARIGVAIGKSAHAEGFRTIANGVAQHVQGRANTVDMSDMYADIVGNGATDWSGVRSNAYALTWTGDGKYAGDVYVHANANSSGGTKLATVNDIPEVPVQDVQVNGTSIIQDGVANVPVATSNRFGVVKQSWGLTIGSDGSLGLAFPNWRTVSSSMSSVNPMTPVYNKYIAFCGLAIAAGLTNEQAAACVPAENTFAYTDTAKEKIQSMLGISQMLAPINPNLVATQAYSIGDVFAANGHLYKATAAIAQDAAIIPDTNCVETTMAEAGGKIKDVQIAGSSIVGSDGVANIPKASTTAFGAASILANGGITLNSEGKFFISSPSETQIKTGTGTYLPLVAPKQHFAVFYGLAKAAGADEKNSTLPVGQYTDTAKSAIRTMIGAASSNVIAVQDTQPTDADTKIWLPETAETPIQVPTVAEMNAALNEKVDDVQVNGVSVVSNGVAHLPLAENSVYGLARPTTTYGVININGYIGLRAATDAQVKDGSAIYATTLPNRHYIAAFYGLAKAAGSDEKDSTLPVGQYTDNAKTAIKEMLGVQDGLKVVRLI